MDVYPLMDILYPAAREAEMVAAMRNHAAPPWSWQAHDAFQRPPEDGSFYFHRDRQQSDPPCTLCIARHSPGKLVVRAIVPDADTVHTIARNRYVQILEEFDAQVAEPAAESVGGMTSIGTASHRLEDYFSPEAIRLLERFCKTSNAGDRGSHLSDQEKWMAFLIHFHHENVDVHCDTFGKCLRTKHWWPDDAISKLVPEFDFAMRLLRQYDQGRQVT